MDVIKKYSGEEAIKVYQKEFQTEPPKDLDYIEICQIPNHNIHAFLVYIKQEKAA